MHGWIEELYPICRSTTGPGVRDTLRIVADRLAPDCQLEIHELPTGTPVLDWEIPREWRIREAWIKGPRGETVVDFRDCNLHVVGYSLPVKARMTLEELRPHLHSLPEHPDWTPYRSSVYAEDWGFCLTHRELERLEDGEYEVYIDSSLEPGSLSYGEVRIPGDTEREVLLSAHVCHPSLCNDNLSGISLLTMLGRYLARRRTRFSYRLLFAPVTIGAIAWLAQNEDCLPGISHGLVVTLVGDGGAPTYKRSRRGDADVDRAFAHVLASRGRVRDFSPYGYDERQFCSPGFDLPVGCLMRTPHGEFPEYHSSADDLSFVKPDALEDSLAVLLAGLEILERDGRFVNQNPKAEPQLGRRGVYRALADRDDGGAAEMGLLWVLNLSDGRHSLLDIAERSGLRFDQVRVAAETLEACGLLVEATT
ncbi:MAG: DUF4910 domain-containing protein [Myxococcota bacterium]|nr:DUF4910 domain-containing protein [Myxococcota bacterium]